MKIKEINAIKTKTSLLGKVKFSESLNFLDIAAKERSKFIQKMGRDPNEIFLSTKVFSEITKESKSKYWYVEDSRDNNGDTLATIFGCKVFLNDNLEDDQVIMARDTREFKLRNIPSVWLNDMRLDTDWHLKVSGDTKF